MRNLSQAARTLAFLCVSLLGITHAHAQATVYTYTGNTYDTFTDQTPPAGTTFNNTMRITCAFEVPTPLPPNQAPVDISGLLTTFSCNNGAHDFTPTDFINDFIVGTGPTGTPVSWRINLSSPRFILDPEWTSGEVLETVGTQWLTPQTLRDIGGRFACIVGAANICALSSPSDRGEVFQPGDWTVAEKVLPVPTPAGWMLIPLALAMAGFAGLEYRRRRARAV